MKIKTSEATGLQLDWGLAKALKRKPKIEDGYVVALTENRKYRFPFYSDDSGLCIDLIKEYKIDITHESNCICASGQEWSAEHDLAYGKTLAQAVARCVIQSPQPNHARALSAQELRGLLYRIEGYQGRSVRDALAFMLLTMVRTKEARLAKWADIDFDQALWIVPAEIMKKRKPHFVPLSKQAMDILERRKEFRDNDEFVFNSPQHRTRELSVTTINQALVYMGCEDITGHDFRATASTVLNANGFSSDWIEKQLAHVEGNAVRRSYNHADYLQDRRTMLQWWADYLDSLKS